MQTLQYDVWLNGGLWMSVCYLAMAEAIAARLRTERPAAEVEVIAAPMNWNCNK